MPSSLRLWLEPDRRDITIEEMASLYIKEMRAFFPQGPYLLGAASYGGFVLVRNGAAAP